ncbi:hypothetical protein [Arthrobacter sp. NPDC080082]|uniref:hypothetical protein n=1 Tax=unclassified Arthrobacter TaxID=235627 RepID=UPI00342F69C4
MPAHTIPAQAWDNIRAEFTLPSLDQVRRRLSELMEDPEPIMRQLVRVFLSGLQTVGVWQDDELFQTFVYLVGLHDVPAE